MTRNSPQGDKDDAHQQILVQIDRYCADRIIEQHSPALFPIFIFAKKKIMNTDAIEILDRIDQYVFLKDKSGIYRYANKAFVEMAGLRSRTQIIGKRDSDLSWTIDIENWGLTDSDVLDGKSIVRAKQKFRYGDGDLRTVMITKVPYRATDGEIIGVLGNFCDCTGQLILETRGTFDGDKHRLYLEFAPEWLSAAEVRVCFYMIHGFSAPRIAEKIGSSVSTIRFHIDNIKNKMQCRSNGEIVEVAMRTGVAWKIFSLHHADDIGPEVGNNHVK